MSESTDTLDYPDSRIPEIVGYIQGMLDTFGLFTGRSKHRQYCIIEMLELPVKDKNKIVQERADGDASELRQTNDYVSGVLEAKLHDFFNEYLKLHNPFNENSKFAETWRYIIWRIAEHVKFLELKDFVKLCIVEKSIITNKENEGLFYILTVDEKYLILLKMHDVRVPKEELIIYEKQ